MNGNEKASIYLAFLAVSSGLFIYFLPQDKATMYIPIPTVIAGASAALLRQSRGKNDN